MTIDRAVERPHALPAAEIVPADLIVIAEGARIPADARIVAGDWLTCAAVGSIVVFAREDVKAWWRRTDRKTVTAAG